MRQSDGGDKQVVENRLSCPPDANTDREKGE